MEDMGYVIAFDTNVFLADTDDCRDFVLEFTASSPPRFKIALDQTGHIEREYFEAYENYILNERNRLDERSTLKDSVLGHITTLIEQMKGVDNPYATWLDAELEDEEMKYLKGIECHEQIEPALFAIASKYSTDAYVLLMAKSRGEIQRGYPNHYDEIRSRYLRNSDEVRKTLRKLIVDSPCPANYESLEKMLKSIRQHGKPQEGERHEFKREFNDDVGKGLPKAVCAMLNKDGGYIFIGIDEKDSFKINGFDWAYKESISSAAKAVETITRTIADSIRPNPAKKINIRHFDLPQNETTQTKFAPDKIPTIVAIYVYKGSEIFCCRDKKGKWKRYTRIGSTNDPDDCPHGSLHK